MQSDRYQNVSIFVHFRGYRRSWGRTRLALGRLAGVTGQGRSVMGALHAPVAGWTGGFKVPVASGTICPRSWETIAPSIGPSSVGWGVECWRASGLPWWRVARNWAEWTGNGSRRTAPWVKRVLGGRDWTQPHRPGQSWEQEEHPGRRSRRAPERGGGWSQRP